MNHWEDKYKGKRDLYGSEMEYKIQSIKDKINPGSILDLGIGEGRNSLWFAYNGFEVYGIDYSNTAISRINEIRTRDNLSIQLTVGDILDYDFGERKYSLIICAWVLNFFTKNEVDLILAKLTSQLDEEGYIYIGSFGTNDPSFEVISKNEEKIDENSFYISEKDSNCFFFTKKYMLDTLQELSLISISEEEYVKRHGKKRMRGIIEYIGRKE